MTPAERHVRQMGEAVAIVKALAATGPFVVGVTMSWCHFCQEDSPNHFGDCLWTRAQRLVAS